MSRLAALAARVRETAHLMVGMPSYAAYRLHMEQHHPERPTMSEAESSATGSRPATVARTVAAAADRQN